MTKVLNTISAIGALALAATPLLAIGGVAHAQDADLQPQSIQIADLNFARPADVARFNARVDAVAERMCVTPGRLTINVACRQAVRDEADQKLDAVRVQAAQAAAVRTMALAER